MKTVFSKQTLLILLLFPLISFGFNLSITPTNETCPGNGSLTFNVSNTAPNGSIVYFVYKLPNVTTPYASGPANVVNGLVAGNYRVIARETVGSNTTTQQQDITITSSFEALTYTVQSTTQACSNTANISVIVNTGTAATYAIISGPATFPAQTSNTFSGLTSGIYRISVTDSCSNSVVQAFTVTVNPIRLTTTNPNFSDTSPPSCDFVVANNTIMPGTGGTIAYPLQVHYILYLPGGAPTHIDTVLNSGHPTSQNISQIIPYYINNDYLYSVTLTDACGITYPPNNFIVNNDIASTADVIPLPCNQYYVTLKIEGFSGAYSLQFTNAPASFDPRIFNTNYPGTYTQTSIDFGNQANPLPFGDYEITITDECGKTDTVEFTVEDIPPVVNAIAGSNGCLSNDGQITISATNTEVVAAIITAAPANYPHALPHDVSAQIDNSGVLNLSPVPQGNYIFRVTDECGTIYDPVPVTVPAYENAGISIDVMPGCDRDMASIRMIGNNGRLTSAKITAAPSSFPFPLPYTISNHILSTGELYLTDLPSGNYTFNATDACNFSSDKTMMIDGYTVTASSFSLVANCGVFNIPLQFTDNLAVPETFWLQKLLNAATDTWGHPITGAAYTSGAIPNATNSYMLQNNANNPNLTFTGVFRIVHFFTSFNNGSDITNGAVNSVTKNCIEILSPNLSFTDVLDISNVYRIPCSTSGSFDVLVSSSSTAVLHYWIVEKDGNTHIVDNGNSNVFLNLAPGIYKFKIEDNCGNSVTRTFDVTDLDSLVNIFPVCNLLSCSPSITGNETFDLSSQNAVILGHQSPTEYSISYHASQADADNNTSPITNLTAFNPVTNPATVYIRLIFNQLPNCYQTASFDLISGQNPRINLLSDYVSCAGNPVVLNASAGNLPTTTYSWSNGLLTPDITISDTGTTTVSVTAANTYGICNMNPLSCISTKDITVNIASVPEISHIDIHDWTDDQNSITVATTNQGAFEYSLDGTTFQDSPVFTNLISGLYTVYVRDTGGCRIVTQEIWLLNYPKFFTPNGDGYNETWYVKNSSNEPDFKIYIFDRYGKLITNILSNSSGWDGKLNGKLLFADDYWFVAHRQDGRILKGHFTLKR